MFPSSQLFSIFLTDEDYSRRAKEVLEYAIETLAAASANVGHALTNVIHLLEDMQNRRAFDPRSTPHEHIPDLGVQGEYGYRIPVWRALEAGLMAWQIDQSTLADRVEWFTLSAKQAVTLVKLKEHAKAHAESFKKEGFKLVTPDFDTFFAGIDGVDEMEESSCEIARLLQDLHNRVAVVWNEGKPEVLADQVQIARYLGWIKPSS